MLLCIFSGVLQLAAPNILHLQHNIFSRFSRRYHWQNIDVGRNAAVKQNGCVHVESGFYCSVYIVVFSNFNIVNAKSLCQTLKTSMLVGRRLGKSVAVKSLLPLAHHAEHLIIHKNNYNRQII